MNQSFLRNHENKKKIFYCIQFFPNLINSGVCQPELSFSNQPSEQQHLDVICFSSKSVCIKQSAENRGRGRTFEDGLLFSGLGLLVRCSSGLWSRRWILRNFYSSHTLQISGMRVLIEPLNLNYMHA